MNLLINRVALALTLILTAFAVEAQVVTSSPAVLQTNSSDIVLTFHADRGDAGLANLPQGQKVYAHTGVLLNTAASTGDWSAAPSWGDNAAKYELTRVDTNTWTLNIGTIASYYGISQTEADRVVDLMFVFRNADGSRTGRGTGGADIAVPVQKAGFVVTISSSVSGSVVTTDAPVDLTVHASAPAEIALYLDTTSSSPLKSAADATELTYSHSLTEPGVYRFIATARSAATGETATDTLTLSRPVTSQEADFPGGVPRMGYTQNADGTVTFCLAAPGKSSVIVVGDWHDWMVDPSGAMHYQDYEGNRYFWITLPNLNDGKNHLYYYLVDGQRAVADPYARLILDPWNDRYIPADVFPNLPAYPSNLVPNGTPLAIYNSDIDQYDWEVETFRGVDQSQLVIYELLIRDFTGTEGQANAEGTVKGVLGKLDYLKSLGVNAIELMPIMEFNGNNSWGYNTNFYFAPDKAYGTPDDYRLLIDECHKRGMAVILDIVFNQSDGLHPWYMMYDIAENPFYNGSAPHAYSVLNDWNQDNALVQQQWRDCLEYWLTAYKADGFRFDLVKGLGTNASYGNTYYPETNTFGTPSDANTNRYNATRVARMRELHDAMRLVNPDAYFINENLATAEEENQMAEDGEINWANVNAASISFACGRTNDMNRFYAPLDNRTWGSTVSYAESHDEQRLAYEQTVNGASGVKGNTQMSMRLLGGVAAQMLMAPGAHMIWQFQELGDAQNTKKADGGNNTDPKRVVWSLLDDPDHEGLMNTYRELCALRADNPELFEESADVAYNCGTAQWGSGRVIRLANNGKELYALVNGRTTMQRTINPGFTSDASGYKLVAASYGTEPTMSGASVTVPAGAFAIYANDAVLGIESVVTPDGGILVEVDAANNVTVSGAESFQLYNVAGQPVSPRGVAPGLYIVRAGASARSILIR